MTQQLQDEKNNSTGKRIDDEENKNVSIFKNISKSIHVRFKRLIIKIKNFYEINCAFMITFRIRLDKKMKIKIYLDNTESSKRIKKKKKFSRIISH